MDINSKIKQLAPYFIALAFSVVLTWQETSLLTAMDSFIADKTWQWVSADTELEQRVIIVDVDEASIARYGDWPWSRERVAQLSAEIASKGAAIQIFDMIFAKEYLE